MLTVYNGTSISYDEIGNPANWHNALSMSWDKRELTSLTLNDNGTLSFAYNSSGLRTQKVYTNGDTVTVHDYILDGTSIISETVTENGVAEYTLYYFYDETGVTGFEYNGAKYHYIKNLQGDIVSIYNNNGAVVVNYTYDAWGKVVSVTGSLASTVGQINPFRYRGYYYDNETEWYYLQSRYYDPSVGRFLNADGFVSTGQGILGNNMFAYCLNNIVNLVDPSGATAVVKDYEDSYELDMVFLFMQLCLRGVNPYDAAVLAHTIINLRMSGNNSQILCVYDTGTPDMLNTSNKRNIEYNATVFIVKDNFVSDFFSGTTFPQFATVKTNSDGQYVAQLCSGIYSYTFDANMTNKNSGYHITKYGTNDGTVPAVRWSPEKEGFCSSEATGIYIHRGYNSSSFSNPASMGCLLVGRTIEDWKRFVKAVGTGSGTLIVYRSNNSY